MPRLSRNSPGIMNDVFVEIKRQNVPYLLALSAAACRVGSGSTWTSARQSAFSVLRGTPPPLRGWRAIRSKRSTTCSWVGCPSTPHNSARARPPPLRPLHPGRSRCWPPSDSMPARAARRASSLMPTSRRACPPAVHFATATAEPTISPHLLGTLRFTILYDIFYLVHFTIKFSVCEEFFLFDVSDYVFLRKLRLILLAYRIHNITSKHQFSTSGSKFYYFFNFSLCGNTAVTCKNEAPSFVRLKFVTIHTWSIYIILLYSYTVYNLETSFNGWSGRWRSWIV